MEFLRNIADIAPSREVRELLFSLIDEMAEELVPAFEFARSPILDSADWDFDYGGDNASITQCKSWWKKLKKCLREVGEFLHLLEKASKSAKNIKRNLDDIRRSNQYNNPRYLDPNYKIE